MKLLHGGARQATCLYCMLPVPIWRPQPAVGRTSLQDRHHSCHGGLHVPVVVQLCMPHHLAALQALSTKPWAFLRLFGLVIYYLKSAMATTARAKQRLWEEQDMDYGTEVGPTPACLQGLPGAWSCSRKACRPELLVPQLCVEGGVGFLYE